MFRGQNKQGFTIVELLIVIVVIAILAAITIVAYNGIQQRAKNTAISNAVSQTLRSIQAYIASTGNYPFTQNGTWVCVTSEIQCYIDVSAVPSNATFDANMATVSSLPLNIPVSGGTRYGIIYQYNTARTMDGVSRPARLVYYLFGTAQQCGVPGVATENGSPSTLVSSTTGYSLADASGTGKTVCFISIPGPAV
jgi:prepilin-type N-terminal cleavage/methylation domain-containing protein